MFEHLIDLVREEEVYRRDPVKLARSVKGAAERILGEVRVYVFGSAAEGRDTPSSDVDVMVVSSKAPKSAGGRSKVVAEILKEVGVDAPLEIHLLSPEEEEWYLRFIKRRVEVT